MSQLSDTLLCMQLGEATPGGCEAAIHATRSYMATVSDDSVLVKLDFNNCIYVSTETVCWRLQQSRWSDAGSAGVIWQRYTALGFEDSSLHSCPKKVRSKHGWRQEHGRYGHDQTAFSSTMATNGLFTAFFELCCL